MRNHKLLQNQEEIEKNDEIKVDKNYTKKKRDEEENCNSLCGMNSICCSSACSSQSCSLASSISASSLSSSSSTSLGVQASLRFAKFLPKCSASLQSSRTTENSITSMSSLGSIDDSTRSNDSPRSKKLSLLIKSKSRCNDESDAFDVEEHNRWAMRRSDVSNIRYLDKNLLQLPPHQFNFYRQQLNSKTMPSSPNMANCERKKSKNPNSFNYSSSNPLSESPANQLSNYHSNIPSSTPSTRRYFAHSASQITTFQMFKSG